MCDPCAVCGRKFDRAPGYLLGSIYFNYGLTALIVAIGYPVLLFNGAMSAETLMAVFLGFAILFPVQCRSWVVSCRWAVTDYFHRLGGGNRSGCFDC